MIEPPLPPSMHGMVIDAGRLRLATLPLPSPAAGDVLIRMAYAGVNRADLLQCEGKYEAPEGASPLPGLEISGHIAALGAGVSGFSLHQPVCALLAGGGYADYATAPATQVLPLPAGVDLAAAATLPEAAATSVMALLSEGALQTGERVLIHGGASGLGILMTQIARALGAEVFATVGSEEKAQLLQQYGITAINHRRAPFAPQLMDITRALPGGKPAGVDLIIDTLGAPALEAHLRLLRPRGRLVTLAMLEGSALPPEVKMTRLLMHQLRWHGATLRNRTPAEKAALMEMVATRVWPALAEGRIHPVIDRVFALAEAEKALTRMQERLHLGKILLKGGD